MDKLHSPENVFYPPMGIAHITRETSDLVREKIRQRDALVIRTSSQPNSNPHLGTVMTLMTAYAIGQHMQEHFGIPASLVFDALENSPASQSVRNNVAYQLSLSDVRNKDGVPLHELYMKTFREILDYLQDKTAIPYQVRFYKEFQELPVIRKAILHILNNAEQFIPLVSPSENKLHLRFPCPVCKQMDKSAANVRVDRMSPEEAVLSNSCPDHGEHSVSVREDNTDFIDANTPIRDILQGVLSLEEAKQKNNVSIMVDGGDWSGVWALRVFCEGLMRFGYGELPYRLFAPVISDWSGAKFSKSLYLQGDAYKYLPEYIIDFAKFIQRFRQRGLDVLWKEAQNWAQDSKKLFRNYSVDYFTLLLDPLEQESHGK